MSKYIFSFKQKDTIDALNSGNAEVWKDIKGYEGLYQISNLGNIKSFYGRRKGFLKAGNISGKLTEYGYRNITLCKDGERRGYLVHRLIAIAFIPNPLNKPHINHIDRNPTNNSIENLEWVTHKENIEHSFQLGRSQSHGNSHYKAKLTNSKVLRIRERAKKGEQLKTIAISYKLNPSTIWFVVHRITWKHI